MRRRCDRRYGIGDPAQPLLPECHLGRKRRLLRQPALDLAPLLRAKHTQYVFGGDQIATGSRIYGVVRAHASRQALSFNSPRRIQLFMVPSGTLMRAASSSYVVPSRNASRMALAWRASNSSRQRERRWCCCASSTRSTAAGAGSLTASADSIGSMRRLTALARNRSIARLRAIATIQVIGLAPPGAKLAALRHTVT